MKRISTILVTVALSVFLLAGCGKALDKKVQHFKNNGVSYDMQLPSGWEADKKVNDAYGLQTTFSAEDTKSNSVLFITTVPLTEVDQKEFGRQTRKKLKERYNYKKEKDIYMKEIKIDEHPAYKYTLNTTFREKNVWAHFYYIWTDHSFVQMTFYSADDNSYEKRSERIDEAVATFKESDFDTSESEQEQVEQEKAAGDIITIENDRLKMETTAVRKLTGIEQKKLLAIRYTFTNLSEEAVQPASWSDYVTAKQNGNVLSLGTLPEDSSLLDVKELVAKQSQDISQDESVESVVLYELIDDSPVELNASQEVFPGTAPTRVVVPK